MRAAVFLVALVAVAAGMPRPGIPDGPAPGSFSGATTLSDVFIQMKEEALRAAGVADPALRKTLATNIWLILQEARQTSVVKASLLGREVARCTETSNLLSRAGYSSSLMGEAGAVCSTKTSYAVASGSGNQKPLNAFFSDSGSTSSSSASSSSEANAPDASSQRKRVFSGRGLFLTDARPWNVSQFVFQNSQIHLAVSNGSLTFAQGTERLISALGNFTISAFGVDINPNPEDPVAEVVRIYQALEEKGAVSSDAWSFCSDIYNIFKAAEGKVNLDAVAQAGRYSHRMPTAEASAINAILLNTFASSITESITRAFGIADLASASDLELQTFASVFDDRLKMFSSEASGVEFSVRYKMFDLILASGANFGIKVFGPMADGGRNNANLKQFTSYLADGGRNNANLKQFTSYLAGANSDGAYLMKLFKVDNEGFIVTSTLPAIDRIPPAKLGLLVAGNGGSDLNVSVFIKASEMMSFAGVSSALTSLLAGLKLDSYGEDEILNVDDRLGGFNTALGFAPDLSTALGAVLDRARETRQEALNNPARADAASQDIEDLHLLALGLIVNFGQNPRMNGQRARNITNTVVLHLRRDSGLSINDVHQMAYSMFHFDQAMATSMFQPSSMTSASASASASGADTAQQRLELLRATYRNLDRARKTTPEDAAHNYYKNLVTDFGENAETLVLGFSGSGPVFDQIFSVFASATPNNLGVHYRNANGEELTATTSMEPIVLTKEDFVAVSGILLDALSVPKSAHRLAAMSVWAYLYNSLQLARDPNASKDAVSWAPALVTVNWKSVAFSAEMKNKVMTAFRSLGLSDDSASFVIRSLDALLKRLKDASSVCANLVDKTRPEESLRSCFDIYMDGVKHTPLSPKGFVLDGNLKMASATDSFLLTRPTSS